MELSQTIIKAAGSNSKIVYLPALEEGDMTRRKPDITKMKQLLNREMITLEQGLKKVLANTKYIL